jgi:hypothetical protein
MAASLFTAGCTADADKRAEAAAVRAEDAARRAVRAASRVEGAARRAVAAAVMACAGGGYNN